MTYQLYKRTLKSGANKGKSIYTVVKDGQPVAQTRPLTIEEAGPLRRIVKDEAKVTAWLDAMQKGKR